MPPRAADLHYRCFTGDDTGLFKRVRLAPSAKAGVVQRWGEQAAGSAVNCCSWGPSATGESFVGAGLSTGVVRFWRASDEAPLTAETVETPRPAFTLTAPEGVSGLHAAGDVVSTARVIACDRLGCVRVWAWPKAGVVGAGASAEPISSFETGGAAPVATFSADGSKLAVGGPQRDLQLWDIEKESMSYKARNVADDKYDLAVPVWVNALCHVPTQPDWVVMGTGYVQNRLQGEVRIYDVRAGRRPASRKEGSVGDEAVRAVAITPDGRYILAGSIAGTLSRLDVRMSLKLCGGYSMTAGSVRSICVHATKPFVAVASLDRHVRLYKLGGGAPVQAVYLKQRLSAMLLSSEAPGPAGDGETDEGHNVEELLRGLPDAEGEAGEEDGEEEHCDDFGMAEIDGGTNPDAADDDDDEEAGAEAAGDDDDDDEEDDDEDEEDEEAAKERERAATRRKVEARLKAARSSGKKNKIKVKPAKRAASEGGAGLKKKKKQKSA